MGRLLPVLFAMIMLGGVGGMDFVLNRSQTAVLGAVGAEGGAESYGSSLLRRMGELFKPAPKVTPADYLPPAPEGWTRRAYMTADGEAITGAKMQKSIVAISTTNDLLQGFANERFPNRQAKVTYQKGARMIALRLRYTPPHELKSFQGQLMGKIADNIKATVAWSRNSYAGIHGVTFQRLAQSSQDVMTRVVTPVAYRRVAGEIGRQWSIRVMTNAGDRDVMAVLAGLDVVGMNKAMEAPLDTITEARPVVMGPDYGLLRYPQDAEMMANVPPPPPELKSRRRASSRVPAAQSAPTQHAEAAPETAPEPVLEGDLGSLVKGWLGGLMGAQGGGAAAQPAAAEPVSEMAPVPAASRPAKPEPGFKGGGTLAAKVCVMRAGKRTCPGK